MLSLKQAVRFMTWIIQL